MSLYCHSCSTELKSGRIPPTCVACGAIFGRNPDWCPTSRPRRRQPFEAREAANFTARPAPGETGDMDPLPEVLASPDANESGKMSEWMIFFKIIIAVPLAAIGLLLLAANAKMGSDGQAIGVGGILVLSLAAGAAITKDRWVLGMLFTVCAPILGLLCIVVLFLAAAAGK